MALTLSKRSTVRIVGPQVFRSAPTLSSSPSRFAIPQFRFRPQSHEAEFGAKRTSISGIPQYGTPQYCQVHHDPISEAFAGFVQRRLIYLRELPQLPAGWSSSNSIAPNPQAVDHITHALLCLSAFVLDHLRSGSSSWSGGNIPKLLFGPIPAGGVSMEVRLQSGDNIYVAAMNNQEVELEVEIDGIFNMIEGVSPRTLSGLLIEQYAALCQ